MKVFEEPVVNVVVFATEDVLTISSNFNPGEGGTPVMPMND